MRGVLCRILFAPMRGGLVVYDETVSSATNGHVTLLPIGTDSQTDATGSVAVTNYVPVAVPRSTHAITRRRTR